MITVNRSRRAPIPGTDKVAKEHVADLHIVPVFGPRGQFLECRVTQGTGGDVPVRLVDGEPVLTRKYRESGWKTMEAYCTENRCIEHFDRWRKWYEMRKQGREINPDQWETLKKSFYPPEILELQARFAGGSERMDAAEIMSELGVDDESEQDKPKRGRPKKSEAADA